MFLRIVLENSFWKHGKVFSENKCFGNAENTKFSFALKKKMGPKYSYNRSNVLEFEKINGKNKISKSCLFLCSIRYANQFIFEGNKYIFFFFL